MKKTIITLFATILLTNLIHAQGNTAVVESTGANAAVAEQAVLSKVEQPVIKSEALLKLEEKQAKKDVKELKQRNKLQRSIMKLENKTRTEDMKLERLQERHTNTVQSLSDVDKAKLELKISKLEMQIAKDKQRLKKLKKKEI